MAGKTAIKPKTVPAPKTGQPAPDEPEEEEVEQTPPEEQAPEDEMPEDALPEGTPETEDEQAPDLEALSAENERMRKALAKANKEAEKSRLEARQLREQVAAAKRAAPAPVKPAPRPVPSAEDASVIEELHRRLATLEEETKTAKARAKTNGLKSQVVAEAARQGFTDPLDAYLLLDTDTVEIDDDGNVEDLPELVQNLAQAKPYLARQPKSAPAIGPTNPVTRKKLTLEAVRNMTPDQINANWEEVQTVLAGNK